MIHDFQAILDPTEYNTPVSFKEVLSDIKRVTKSMSASARGGTGFEPTDIVGSMLKKNWGNFLEKKAPEEALTELKALNEDYRPFASAKKMAGKIFKPYDTETNTKAGTQFLKSYALNGFEAGLEKMLCFV